MGEARRQTLIVGASTENENKKRRLDSYLSQACPELSRSLIQKLIRDGHVSVNGGAGKASRPLNAGDEIVLMLPEPEPADIQAEDIPLDILYEDQDICVINKPKGMVVHPAAGHSSGTLVNALLYHCRGQLSGINGQLRPGIVHRIDRDTTGSLVICKNDRAHREIAGQLAAHTINRRYRAVVCGNLPQDEGIVNAPIGRHRTDRKRMAVVQGGKEAVTHYRVLERFGSFTYIECRLETGRTHQIRVHMSSINHPLLGDDVYGHGHERQAAGLTGPLPHGQVLHAMTLGLIHPSTGEYMEFEAPLPRYFEELLERLRRRGAGGMP